MVKIRLKRMGMKKKPFYRVVVADINSPRDGRNIAEIGYYDPMTEPATVKIDAEAAKKWLADGAQPTDTVRRLLKSSGVLEG
ncbi:MAG TPA: 30S ribosomal protein S16 [Candidatus Limiplasma sp.]|nr:30S ribosomal protein S16 [Candidatus Limiplasma sp.]HRX07530.1 30S ribosomal protein S16 [Candidatus Limiplasma sp.]